MEGNPEGQRIHGRRIDLDATRSVSFFRDIILDRHGVLFRNGDVMTKVVLSTDALRALIQLVLHPSGDEPVVVGRGTEEGVDAAV